MRYRLKKIVALVGMMGAGKSAIGKALATILSVPFVDSDAEIESASNMAISEIFTRVCATAPKRNLTATPLPRYRAAAPLPSSRAAG